MNKFNYNQCGKYFAKGLKLKVHIQNVHEIEKITYESMNDIMEMINTFRNLQNSNVKFVKKKLLERKFLKYIWKMSIKDFKKYKFDECGKNFTHNIGLKGHITAVHERKDSIVINVAKILLEYAI